MSTAKRKRTQTSNVSTPCSQFETQFKPTGGAFLVCDPPPPDHKHEDSEACPIHRKIRLSGDHLLLVDVLAPKPTRFWQKIHVGSDYHIRVIKSSRKRDALPGTLLFFESAEQRLSFQKKFKGDVERMCSDVVVTWLSKFHSYRYPPTFIPTRTEALNTEDVEESLQKLLSFSAGQQSRSSLDGFQTTPPSQPPVSLTNGAVEPSPRRTIQFVPKTEPSSSSSSSAASATPLPPNSNNNPLLVNISPPRQNMLSSNGAGGVASSNSFSHSATTNNGMIGGLHPRPAQALPPPRGAIISLTDSMFDSDAHSHWAADSLPSHPYVPASPTPSFGLGTSPLHEPLYPDHSSTHLSFSDAVAARNSCPPLEASPSLPRSPFPQSMVPTSPGYDILGAANPLSISDASVPPGLSGLPLTTAFDSLSVGVHSDSLGNLQPMAGGMSEHSNGVAPMQTAPTSGSPPNFTAVAALPDWLLQTLRQSLPSISSAVSYGSLPSAPAVRQSNFPVSPSGAAPLSVQSHQSDTPFSRAAASSSGPVSRVKLEPVMVPGAYSRFPVQQAPHQSSQPMDGAFSSSTMDSRRGHEPGSLPQSSASVPVSSSGLALSPSYLNPTPPQPQAHPQNYVYQEIIPPSRHQPHVTHIHNYFFIINAAPSGHPTQNLAPQ